MNGLIKSAIGLFIGENSHKREIGVAFIALFTLLFYLNLLTIEQYESVMGLCIIWTGWAQNARIKKVQQAFINAKK